MAKSSTASVTVTSRNGKTTTHPDLASAVRTVVAGRARDKALNTGPQRDIEDSDQAGVHPKQREHETDVGGIAADRLRSIIERTERLEEEKKALQSDIKDIMSEAKSARFDVKVIREILRQRRQEPAAVEEHETLLDIYRRCLGM